MWHEQVTARRPEPAAGATQAAAPGCVQGCPLHLLLCVAQVQRVTPCMSCLVVVSNLAGGPHAGYVRKECLTAWSATNKPSHLLLSSQAAGCASRHVAAGLLQAGSSSWGASGPKRGAEP